MVLYQYAKLFIRYQLEFDPKGNRRRERGRGSRVIVLIQQSGGLRKIPRVKRKRSEKNEGCDLGSLSTWVKLNLGI